MTQRDLTTNTIVVEWDPDTMPVESMLSDIQTRRITIYAGGHTFTPYHRDPDTNFPHLFLNGQPTYEMRGVTERGTEWRVEGPNVYRFIESKGPLGELVRVNPKDLGLEVDHW